MISPMNWFQREKDLIFQTYRRQPLVLVKGRGSWVWDEKGARYLDFFSGLAVNNLGHCHPAVVRAAAAQSRVLGHASNVYYTVPQIRLAGELVARSFPGRVFFSNSGAEAVECALKIARRWGASTGGRTDVISFQNSFHGRTLAALTLTGQEKYRKGFDPLVPGIRYAAFNDLESVRRAATKKTGAVFVEPIQGEGGVVPADGDFLAGLRVLCDRNRWLLVFDEVQCGLGRTGRLFAFQSYGVRPDVLVLAKALGGGLPMGATVAARAAAALLGAGDHASTFGGNPVVCSAALAVLKVMDPKFLKSVARKGAILREGLEKLRDAFPGRILSVRGAGLMLGLQLSGPGGALVDALREEGLLANCTQDTVLRLLPPLTVSEAEIRAALRTLGKVFAICWNNRLQTIPC